MTPGRAIRRVTVIVVALWLVWASPTAFAQDALARAKTFYAAADYEAALQVLATMSGTPANAEASAYQVFCLVALGRRDEARAVVESIVRTDPLYRPSQTQVAPRIRTFFDEIRKPLLSEVARQAYAKAKTAFDQKDFAGAIGDFDRALSLLSEIDHADQSEADLRTLALGFRDLAHVAALASASQPEPVPVAAAPPPAAEPLIYGPQHAGVKPPEVVMRRLPEWRPNFFELNRTFAGDLELVIGEDGKVLSASLLTSVHPRYDGPLLDAARNWTFRPATKNGVAVKYRYITTIQILK